MTYESILRKKFQGIELDIEDVYLLERFQLAYLPERVPQREFAAVLWANAAIKRFLIRKHPPIADFIEDVLARYDPAASQQELNAFSDRLVWEIADQLIYVKQPDVYDERVDHGWDFDEVTSNVPLEHKVVIDAGAGTGWVAFAAVQTARLVFAVEPITSLRKFIRDKAAKIGATNLYAIDGFLHAIPLPDGFADVLITSNAIGWQLAHELREIERVVKRGGYAIHLCASLDNVKEPRLHSGLTSARWQYEFAQYEHADGWKIKYWKQV